MKIRGIEGITGEKMKSELLNGAKFVSLIVNFGGRKDVTQSVVAAMSGAAAAQR